MVTYKTPGVYPEEISTLPPSVAEVSTAIPAFIGCTQIGPKIDANGNVVPVVARINTMLEFQAQFGEPYASSFTVSTQPVPGVTNGKTIQSLQRVTPAFDFLLYYSLSMYFKNGGGRCYIVSIGDYSAAPTKGQFLAGLQALEKEDEPTLIVLTDAVNLAPDDYYEICQQVLADCETMRDRFAIFDVLNTPDGVQSFRNGIGINYLSYGAAYYPYIQTTLNYAFQESLISITVSNRLFQKAYGTKGISVRYQGSATDAPKVAIVAGGAEAPITFTIASNTLTINTDDTKTGVDVAAAWTAASGGQSSGFVIVPNGDGSAPLKAAAAAALDVSSQPDVTLAALKSTDTSLYNQIKAALALQRVVLPPSGAVAGLYAATDRQRGVWKAPANVSLAATIGPVVKITNNDQEDLNVDTTAGKSINAIRAFTGKGTLVWGARTLAGNDNEWRYVPVRRLFLMIEESTQKATSFAVFEPNDATTWLKVKAMIESFLFGLWEQGALAGSTAEAAYYVHVGLGKTMTAQDILEGRIIVEIGIAAVRPAEFIILRFSHRLQQA